MATRKPYANPLVDSAVQDWEAKFADAFKRMKAYIRQQVAALNRDGQILVRDRFNMAQIRNIVNPRASRNAFGSSSSPITSSSVSAAAT